MPAALIMKSFPLVWVTLLAITTWSVTAHRPDHDQQQQQQVVAAEEDDPNSRIRLAMESAEIVPDVVGKAPSQLIKVSCGKL